MKDPILRSKIRAAKHARKLQARMTAAMEQAIARCHAEALEIHARREQVRRAEAARFKPLPLRAFLVHA